MASVRRGTLDPDKDPKPKPRTQTQTQTQTHPTLPPTPKHRPTPDRTPDRTTHPPSPLAHPFPPSLLHTPLPLLPHKPLLPIQFAIQRKPLRPRARHHGHARQRTHDDPNDLQRLGVAADQIESAGVVGRHARDDLDELGGVAGVGRRVRGERGVRLQLGEEAVLEDDATDRDAELWVVARRG